MHRTKQAPEWLSAWRTIILRVLYLEFNCLRQMARLVRLCLRPRSWLTLAEEQELKEMHRKDLTRPKVSQKHCTHPEFQRYGNAHGRYSRCKRCDLKFKWLPEHEAWVEYSPKSSSSSALPLPSAANILEKGPLAMKAASPKRVSKGKGKSRMTAPVPSSRRTSSMSVSSASSTNKAQRYDMTAQDYENFLQTGLTKEEYHEMMETVNSEAFPDSEDPDGYPADGWDW